MYRMKRFQRLPFVYLIAGVLLASPITTWAYTDEIALKTDEVWKAVQEVFEPHGISKAKKNSLKLESKWIKDHVIREKKILFLKPTLKKNVERRYRFQVKLNEKAGRTEVIINGKFQERPHTNRPQTPWDTLKPKPEDHYLERTYFHKILKQIEKNRRLSPPKPPVTISQ